jgi:hypothetical protein
LLVGIWLGFGLITGRGEFLCSATWRGRLRGACLKGDQCCRKHLGGVLDDGAKALPLQPPEFTCQGLGEASVGNGSCDGCIEILR